MNRRSFLAALPLVPAALVALSAEPRTLSLPPRPEPPYEAGEWVRISGTSSGLDGFYEVLIADTPRDTRRARNPWTASWQG